MYPHVGHLAGDTEGAPPTSSHTSSTTALAPSIFIFLASFGTKSAPCRSLAAFSFYTTMTCISRNDDRAEHQKARLHRSKIVTSTGPPPAEAVRYAHRLIGCLPSQSRTEKFGMPTKAQSSTGPTPAEAVRYAHRLIGFLPSQPRAEKSRCTGAMC